MNDEDYVIYGILVRDFEFDVSLLRSKYCFVRVKQMESSSVMVQADEKSNYILLGKECKLSEYGIAILSDADISTVDTLFKGYAKIDYYYVCPNSGSSFV